jgi:phage replication O-like protein O
MAGPQVEDGYMPIANELLEAILRYPFGKRHLKVLLALMRKTYGYRKKADELSATQIANMTGIPRQHVAQALVELSRMRVVLKQDGKHANSLSINKNYGQWGSPKTGQGSPETGQSQNRTSASPETGQGVVLKQDTQKTTPKNNSKKQYMADFEAAWIAYPKRAGGNPKARALKAWQARLAAGVDPADMLAGVERYAAFCEATDKNGTEYVKQAATFFGPDEAFLESWQPPRGGNGAAGKAHSDGPRPSAVERVERATRSGGRTFDAES